MAKNRIPKKVAGIKIPKILRKNSLLKGLLGSATGRQLVADALVAAATAAATVLAGAKGKAAAKASSSALHDVEDGAKIAKRALKSAAGALTESLGNAAKATFGIEDDNKQRRQSRPH
jgi:hypothetical protein